ncbi:hypothetical protein TEA_010630 [Camellia sinensis var. sinensis]|uniref:Uncharacterized protein n=1 Tax=Camellia sinensis var. sinensis TaxID=542762 RepID=A0A4S4D9J7_CAMSN|nr:hypothetical protein TEA_010630 [Camellia sinensis var. sinensis]
MLAGNSSWILMCQNLQSETSFCFADDAKNWDDVRHGVGNLPIMLTAGGVSFMCLNSGYRINLVWLHRPAEPPNGLVMPNIAAQDVPTDTWANKQIASDTPFDVTFFRHHQPTTWSVQQLEDRGLLGVCNVTEPAYPRIV